MNLTVKQSSPSTSSSSPQPTPQQHPPLTPSSTHVPGWYPSTPASSDFAVKHRQYSDRSDRSSIMTCSMDDGFLTANQTSVNGSFLHSPSALSSAGSHTNSLFEEPTGSIIDLHNLHQNLLNLSSSAQPSTLSSQQASPTSLSLACSTSSKLTHAADMGSHDGNHSINATSAAFPAEDVGSQSDQVIESSVLPAHPHTRNILSTCDDSVDSSGSHSDETFAYRTIGPAIVLKIYQPKQSPAVESISIVGTTPENSPQDFDQLGLPPPYSCCSDSIYPESGSVGPDTIDVTHSTPTMPLLEIDDQLPENNTEQPDIPVGLGADTTLLNSDEIVESHNHVPARSPAQPIDEVEDVSSEDPDSSVGPALEKPAAGPQDTQLSAPDPQAIEVSIPGNSAESLEDPSHHEPIHPPEIHQNSPPEIDASPSLSTLPPILPQVHVTGCSLMEASSDLMTFDSADGLDEKCLGHDLPKVTPEAEQPTPSELSSTDTLNEPVPSSEPAVVQAEGNPFNVPTAASQINQAHESIGASTNDCPAEATPEADTEMSPTRIIAPASRQTPVLEPQPPHDLQFDQSPVTTAEPQNVVHALNNEPVASVDTTPQEPTSDDKVATVPEEFLIVAGLNPEQAPATNHPASANTPVPNELESTKALEPSQAGSNDGPANPSQTVSSNLPTVSFPPTRPAEEKPNTWSINPTNRLSSSTEIVDPLLRSNIFNQSVRDTHLSTVVDSPEPATGKTKDSTPVRPKRTLRARSISGFFKLNTKKELAKADLAHSPTSTSIHSSEEETRSLGKKLLQKRKSLSTLRRKSGLSWINRSVDGPVPPLPNKLPETISTNDQPKSSPAIQCDEKLKVAESVESSNLPAEHSNPTLAPSPEKQERKSEQSLPADATLPRIPEGKPNKSPRQFKVSLAKRYFRSESARVEATNGSGENLEGPFSSVIGGIGYSPSAPRAKTLRKKRTMSTHVSSTPVLKDLSLSGLFSKLLGRKSHADEIVQGA